MSRTWQVDIVCVCAWTESHHLHYFVRMAGPTLNGNAKCHNNRYWCSKIMMLFVIPLKSWRLLCSEYVQTIGPPVFEERVSSCLHIWLILTALLRELTEDKIHTHCSTTLHGPHSILLNDCPRRGEWLLTCRLLPLKPPDLNLGNHYLWGELRQLHLSVLDNLVHTYCWNTLGTSDMESQGI
jgi:hypothetical protein